MKTSPNVAISSHSPAVTPDAASQLALELKEKLTLLGEGRAADIETWLRAELDARIGLAAPKFSKKLIPAEGNQSEPNLEVYFRTMINRRVAEHMEMDGQRMRAAQPDIQRVLDADFEAAQSNTPAGRTRARLLQ